MKRVYPAIEDITARKWVEQALRESEARYHRLFDSIDEGFCVIEEVEGEAGEPVDFRCVEANPAFAAHSGVSDVVGKTREAHSLAASPPNTRREDCRIAAWDQISRENSLPQNPQLVRA